MSTAPIPSHEHLDLDGWVTPEQLSRAGFRPAAPEIDYGQRWGSSQSIRVSYAPLDDEHGFLYAHDSKTDRAMVLSADTTHEAVEQAFSLLPRDYIEDGHLALAAILDDAHPLTPSVAEPLWTHCVKQEITARRSYLDSEDPIDRLSSARRVIVNATVRMAAEHMLETSLADHDPVLVRYRVPGWPDWNGRYAAADLDSAMARGRQLLNAAAAAGFAIQATSVSCGLSVVAAARVPALDFLTPPVLTADPDLAPAI